MADSTGTFSMNINGPHDTISISSAGYTSIEIEIFPTADSVFHISLDHLNNNESSVTVRASINKGLYLWRKIMERKKRFDPWEQDNFSYNQYSKTGIDIQHLNLKKLNHNIFLKPFSFILNPLSKAADSAGFIPAYLVETRGRMSFQKLPRKKSEYIDAINNRGFLEEGIAGMMGELNKEVDIFSEYIPIMKHDYAGPFNSRANIFYRFWVADTQKINDKNIFHLVFAPANRTSDLFSGDAWVEAGSFRLIRASLYLGNESGLNFITRLTLFQEYIPGPSSTLVVKREKMYADLKTYGNRSPSLSIKRNSLFSHFSINSPEVKSKFEKQAVPYESGYASTAFHITDSTWNKIRPDTLSAHEKLVYQMIDRLASDEEYGNLKDKFKFAGSGYLNIGKLEVGRWFSVFSGNRWEGFRTRVDLGTNKKFSKNIHIHSYVAYGTKDMKFKGVGEIFWIAKRGKYWTQWHASYIADIDNRVSQAGGIGADNIFSLAFRKPGSLRRFLHIKQFTLSLQRDLGSGFRIEGYGSWVNVQTLQNLPPATNYTPLTTKGKPLTTAEIALKLRIAPGERLITGDFFRYPIAQSYPVVQLTAGYGFPGLAGSDYRYSRIGADVNGAVSLRRAGKLYYNFYGEQYFGTIPFSFLPSIPGNDGYYYSPRVNNLLYRYEYLSDRYAGYRIEHNIGQGVFRGFSFTRKLKWTQFWNFRMTWAGLSAANKIYNSGGAFFKTPNGKPYAEIGTGIENIFRVLRLDFVWRLLPHPLPADRVSRFGVFGSFKFRL